MFSMKLVFILSTLLWGNRISNKYDYQTEFEHMFLMPNEEKVCVKSPYTYLNKPNNMFFITNINKMSYTFQKLSQK